MITNISAAGCKHPTEKLMRSGVWVGLIHESTLPKRVVWGVLPPKSWDWAIKPKVMPDL